MDTPAHERGPNPHRRAPRSTKNIQTQTKPPKVDAECGFAHVAGLVEWHHTCVRIYLRSFAGKHTHTHIAQTDCVSKSNLKNNEPYIAWVKKNGRKIAFLRASDSKGGPTQSI